MQRDYKDGKTLREMYHQEENKNGIAWDNRDENIELLTPEEHARHHAMQRSQAKQARADGGEEQ